MAYVQKPGRGNGAKTGSGIPGVLLQTKEKGFFDSAVDKVKEVGSKIKKGYKEFDKMMKEGSSGDSRYGGAQDRVFGVQLHGANAGKKEVPVKKAPTQQRVSKKTAYDIKEASNQKLKPGARKHYAENAQAAMKDKKKK